MRLLVPVLILFVVACGGANGGFVMDAADQNVLPTLADAQPLLSRTVSGAGAPVWEKTQDFDGAWNLSYEVESEDFYLQSTLFMETDADAASWVFAGAGLANPLLSAQGIETVPAPRLCSAGDETRCDTLRMDGIDIGNLCLARHGNLVVMLMMSGATLRPPLACDTLIARRLANMQAHTPASVPLTP